jgi:hypothetical protein
MFRKLKQELLQTERARPALRGKFALRISDLAKEFNQEVELPRYPRLDELHACLNVFIRQETKLEHDRKLTEWKQQNLIDGECVVCLERGPGFTCPFEHHICSPCLSRYLEINLSNSRHHVKKTEKIHLWKLPCMSPHCAYLFTEENVHDWLVHLSPRMLSSELTTLREELQTELGYQTNHQSLINKILKTQELTCPFCERVLDPQPDGCCAMRCPHCGTYFCWVCFVCCADNTACHDHVRNKHGNVFAPPETIKRGHIQSQRDRFTRTIQSLDSSVTNRLMQDPRVKAIQEQLFPDSHRTTIKHTFENILKSFPSKSFGDCIGTMVLVLYFVCICVVVYKM